MTRVAEAVSTACSQVGLTLREAEVQHKLKSSTWLTHCSSLLRVGQEASREAWRGEVRLTREQDRTGSGRQWQLKCATGSRWPCVLDTQ